MQCAFLISHAFLRNMSCIVLTFVSCSMLLFLTNRGLFNNYVTPRGWVILIGSVHNNAFSCEKAYS